MRKYKQPRNKDATRGSWPYYYEQERYYKLETSSFLLLMASNLLPMAVLVVIFSETQKPELQRRVLLNALESHKLSNEKAWALAAF